MDYVTYFFAWTNHPIGQVHLICAFAALITGPTIFFRRKGTRSHRWIGYVYFVSMVVLNIAALFSYRLTGGANLFHGAAVASMATIIPAIYYVWRFKRTRKRGHMIAHGMFMSWSYFGLVMAFISEIVTRQFPALLHGSGGWASFILFVGTLMALTGWWTNRQIRTHVIRRA